MENKTKYRILIATADTQFLMWLQLVLTNIESELKKYVSRINIISQTKQLVVESSTDIDLAFVDEEFILKKNNTFLTSLRHNHPACLLAVILSSAGKGVNNIITRLNENELQIFAGYIVKDNYSLQILKTVSAEIIEKMISYGK